MNHDVNAIPGPTGPLPNGEPKVLAFACRWCAGIGADSAGKQRIAMPVGFRLIMVECAAQIDPDIVLKAFSRGIDGVAILGCHLEGCRYNRANHTLAKRMALLATLLDAIGAGSQRLLTSFGTAHEGHQFADLMQGFADRLRTLPAFPGCVRGFSTEGGRC